MDTEQPIRRVWLEMDVCMAHGLCVDACPEVFYFPDKRNPNGTLTVHIRDDADRYFGSHADGIRYAEYACPVAAIHIEC
jgi:ferredoxin